MTVGCSSRSTYTPVDGLDVSYLTSEMWNDGLAEVAFYEVERSEDQYGRDTLQTFLVGTYLVKHDFDVRRQSKAHDRGMPAFKYAAFYRFESGSYEYRRHYVANVSQADLRLVRSSFTSFDWCSNLYREIAVDTDLRVRAMRRSDDYGNDAWTYRLPRATVTPELVPILARASIVDAQAPVRFEVLELDGTTIAATLEHVRSDDESDTFIVHYARPVTSPFGETSDMEETIVVGRSPFRPVLSIVSGTGRYRVRLIESVRSAYWEEDVFERLQRVDERP
jgi:hypothetical protein